MALIGALYILWLCCARRRIALTAKLVEQSVVVVSTHPGLFAVSGVLFVVKILSVALCFVSAIAVLVLIRDELHQHLYELHVYLLLVHRL